jgi:hypothetical protein
MTLDDLSDWIEAVSEAAEHEREAMERSRE